MWVATRGLLATWRYSLGAIFEAIGGVRISIKWAPDIHPFAFLEDFSRRVENNLTTAAKGYEAAMGFWFHQVARLQLWIAAEVWQLARDSFRFGDFLVTSYIPHRIHDATHALHSTTRTLVKTVTKVERIVVKVPTATKTIARAAIATTIPAVVIPHVGELKWIHSHWKALTKAVAAAGAIAVFPPIAIPRIFPRIRNLERGDAALRKRLHRVEGLLGAGVFAAAMANVLGLRSPGCLRSGNIGKVARRLCGLDSAILGGLLAGLIVLEGQISLEDFARELLSVEQELGNLVLRGFSELDGVQM
jgi:hypothetical protein